MSGRQEETNDFIDAEKYGVDELREAAFGRSETLSRPLALMLLGRKNYPQKVADLARLLSDEQEESRLRKMAAVELGRIGTPQAIERLETALHVKDSLVRQTVTEALAGSGREQAHAAVRRLRPGKQAALAETRQWANQLMSVRLGARGGDILAPPQRKWLRVDDKRAVPVRVRPGRPGDVAEAVRDLSAGPLKVTLSQEHAVQAQCGDRQFLFLFEREFLQQPPEQLLRKKAAPAVVAEKHTLEGEGWEARYLVITQPVKHENQTRVLLTSSSGTVAMVGTVGLDDQGRLAFRVQTADQPGAVPVEVEGLYESRELRFQRFLSELTSRGRTGPGLRKR